MNKYRSIDLLVERLAGAIAGRQVAIAQRWLDDEQAIGFYKPDAPDLSAYVSTHGQPPGYYDLELEYPALDDNDTGNAPTKADDLQLDDLVGLLAMHFELDEIGR